jgi:hypothetical protein
VNDYDKCDDSKEQEGKDPVHQPNSGQDDKRDAERVKQYGLAFEDVIDDGIVVPEGVRMRLPGRASDSAELKRLTPKSLDDVKRWIGVPDHLASKRCQGCVLPSEIPAAESAAQYRSLDPNVRRSMHALARHYVYGDSRSVSAYKPVIERVIDRASIVGTFLRRDIDIHSGAVLEVGKQIKVLFARHIRIWRGGQLRISGDARIDCVSIQGNYSDRISVNIDTLSGLSLRLLRGE